MLTLLAILACGSAPQSDDTIAPGQERGWWSANPGDADGDGFTAAEGDCDDGLASVNPGVTEDICDNLDNDCDGTIDEDSTFDEWERNGDNAANLGDLTDSGETILVGSLHNSSDIDRYQFRVTDGAASWFDIEAWLYNIPLNADYSLELEWIEDSNGQGRGVIATSDSSGMGGFEMVETSGTTGLDDSGLYELRVMSSSGADCTARYTIQLLIGGV